MDEHKKVRVTMNEYSNSDKKHDLEYYLTPKSNNNNSKSLAFGGRSMLAKMIKPIMLAVLLGVIFGGGLMYFFSDLTPDAVPVTSVDDEEEDGQDNDNNNDNNNPDDSTSFNITGKTYEIIQFGVFSSQENANELIQSLLTPKSIPAAVQEHNNQFYVISHMIYSEQEKDSITEWLESQGLEYMNDFLYKSWNFESVSTQVTDDQKIWLEEGLNLIENYRSTSNSSTWLDETKVWLNNAPDAYQNITKLNHASELISKAQANSDQVLKDFYTHTILLNIHLFFSDIS